MLAATIRPESAMARGPVSPPVSLMARRALLLAGRDLDALQDQVDGAELLLVAGMPDAARLLSDVVVIRRGFAPFGRTDGPLGGKGGPRPASRRGRQMIACAAEDLRALMAMSPGLPPLPARGVDLDGSARSAGRLPAFDAAAFATLVAALRDALPAAGDSAGFTDPAAAVARLRAEIVSRPTCDLADEEARDLPDLAALLAFNSLRRFALSVDRLAHAPFGSPALLAATARLDDAGVGPYLRNLHHLLQESRDCLGLIKLAAGTEPLDRETVERWAVLLAAPLQGQRRQDLVDDLADAGLMRAVWGIMAVEHTMRDRPDRGLLWRVRDAGLDTGDIVLAARAQQTIVAWWPDDRVEWIILADIHATMGDRAAMGQALEQAVRLDPGHAEATGRQAALRSGDLAPYRLRGGFMTSPARRAARAAFSADGGTIAGSIP